MWSILWIANCTVRCQFPLVFVASNPIEVLRSAGRCSYSRGVTTLALDLRVAATVDVSFTAMEGDEMADERRDMARRLRELRAWRDKPLKVIAERAGITEGYLSRLERGERRLDKRSTIAALAAALEVSPSELIGQPVRWEDPAMAEAQAPIPALRVALAETELGQSGTGSVRPVGGMSTEVNRCVALRSACDFAAMGAMLPGLLADLYATVAVARDEERAVTLRQLIRALNSAMTLAHAFGYADLAYLVTERSAQAADDLRDPAWSAVAAFSRVHALLPIGAHSHAYAFASRATDAARSVAGEVSGSPALASYGSI